MDTYTYDTVALSKIAIKISKQDDSFIDDATMFLNRHNNEDGYIQVSNMLFSFYNSLYDSAACLEEKKTVVKNMNNAFAQIFEDRYIPTRCWELMLTIRKVSGYLKECFAEANELINLMDENKFPITSMYVYRRIANYIVNGDLFYIEPFTTLLSNMIDKIENVEFDMARQPNYLS